MKRLTILLPTLMLAACGSATTTAEVDGLATDRTAIAGKFQEAVNSQDVETALELLADDSAIEQGETSIITGKEPIADWLVLQTQLHYQFKGDPMASDSGVTFEDCSVSSYQWSFYGIQSMSGTCAAAIDDGLITDFTVRFDESSRAELSDSAVAATADLIGTWITRNYMTDSGDLHLQLFEDGSGRLAGTDDPDHEGATLAWTYEDFVLTLKNAGPASDGYCQEQDVGQFLVKNADGGGLSFKTITDSCALRATAFQLPPRWRPQEP
jgi:hypothetical protein